MGNTPASTQHIPQNLPIYTSQYIHHNSNIQQSQSTPIPYNNYYINNPVPAINQFQCQQMYQPNLVPPNTQHQNTASTSKLKDTPYTYNTRDTESSDSEVEITPPEKNPWQCVTNNKRKRIKILHTKNTQSNISQQNKFSILDMEDSNDKNENEVHIQENKAPKPPPIFVHGVMDYNKMVAVLTDVAETEQYKTKTLANNVVKINANTSDTYRKLIKYMKESGIAHHTYQLKENRAYRVVIRNLHHTVPIEELKELLHKEGFPVRAITNIQHRKTKAPLPMFYVDLEPAENNKDIYKLRFLNNQVIKVEPPHKKHTIVQCTRCQQYNHTKTYCTLPFACVKCGGSHDSKTCTKSRNLPAKCALCKEDHPANYRGCTVYKEIQQKIRQGASVQSRIPHQEQPVHASYTPHQTPIRSYSQVTQGPQNHHQNDNITLSRFLEEFKSMFSQLINQNNMVINMLTTVINKLVK